jgi:GT2 family glycosyltransferase
MISVVTVNYKTSRYLEKMLASLFKHHDENAVEVFVIENDSGDDLCFVRERYPTVKLIESEKNLGFAGGCNLGIKKAKGDFVLLVNPDIVFTKDSINDIELAMRNNPDVGIGGASLKNLDGTQQNCVWSFPTPVDQLMVLLKLHHIFPNLPPIKKWLMKDFDYSKSKDVDQVMGAFFCIRQDVIDDIGMMDDGFFIWYEEVDYCRRAKNAGWKTRYFADILVSHKKGSSFESVATIEKQKVLRKSIRRYMFKHYGVVVGMIFLVLEPLFILMSFLASILKPV